MTNPGVIWVSAGVLLLAGAAALIAYDHWKNPADIRHFSARLDGAMARAKAAGVPLTPADIQPLLAEREGKNAAPIIRELAALPDAVYHTKAYVEDAATGGSLSNVKAALNEAKPLLDLAERTKECTVFRPRVTLERGVAGMGLESLDLQGLAQLLSIRAAVRVEDGDAEGALSDLRGIQNMGRLCGQELSLAASGAEVIVREEAALLALWLAGKWENRPDRLERLDQTFRQRPMPPLMDALRVDAALAILSARSYADVFTEENGYPTQMDQLNGPKLSDSAVPSTARGRAGFARMLEELAALFEEAGKDGQENPLTAARLAKLCARFAGSTDPSAQMGRHTLDWYGTGWTGLGSLGDVMASEQAVKAALAVLRARARLGRMPTSLEEAGFTEKDPVHGESLQYLRTVKGFRVWSKGADGFNNGGTGTDPRAVLPFSEMPARSAMSLFLVRRMKP